MRYPNWWNKTVTIYHCIRKRDENGRSKIQWSSVYIPRCFWGQTRTQNLINNVISIDTSVIVRIPYSPNIKINEGDLIILGEVSDNIPDNDSGNTISEKYGTDCIKVKTVKYNKDIKRLKHIYASEV